VFGSVRGSKLNTVELRRPPIETRRSNRGIWINSPFSSNSLSPGTDRLSRRCRLTGMDNISMAFLLSELMCRSGVEIERRRLRTSNLLFRCASRSFSFLRSLDLSMSINENFRNDSFASAMTDFLSLAKDFLDMMEALDPLRTCDPRPISDCLDRNWDACLRIPYSSCSERILRIRLSVTTLWCPPARVLRRWSWDKRDSPQQLLSRFPILPLRADFRSPPFRRCSLLGI